MADIYGGSISTISAIASLDANIDFLGSRPRLPAPTCSIEISGKEHPHGACCLQLLFMRQNPQQPNDELPKGILSRRGWALKERIWLLVYCTLDLTRFSRSATRNVSCRRRAIGSCDRCAFKSTAIGVSVQSMRNRIISRTSSSKTSIGENYRSSETNFMLFQDWRRGFARMVPPLASIFPELGKINLMCLYSGPISKDPCLRM